MHLNSSCKSNTVKKVEIVCEHLSGCLEGRLGHNEGSLLFYFTQKLKNHGEFLRVNSLLLYKGMEVNFFKAASINI